MAEQVNATVREAESRVRMMEIYERLHAAYPQLIAPHVKFVREMDLQLSRMTAALARQPKLYRMWLLSDRLLLARPDRFKPEFFHLKEQLRLEAVTLTRHQGAFPRRSAATKASQLIIRGPEVAYVLQPASTAQADDVETLISKAIEENRISTEIRQSQIHSLAKNASSSLSKLGSSESFNVQRSTSSFSMKRLINLQRFTQRWRGNSPLDPIRGSSTSRSAPRSSRASSTDSKKSQSRSFGTATNRPHGVVYEVARSSAGLPATQSLVSATPSAKCSTGTEAFDAVGAASELTRRRVAATSPETGLGGACMCSNLAAGAQPALAAAPPADGKSCCSCGVSPISTADSSRDATPRTSPALTRSAANTSWNATNWSACEPDQSEPRRRQLSAGSSCSSADADGVRSRQVSIGSSADAEGLRRQLSIGSSAGAEGPRTRQWSNGSGSSQVGFGSPVMSRLTRQCSTGSNDSLSGFVRTLSKRSQTRRSQMRRQSQTMELVDNQRHSVSQVMQLRRERSNSPEGRRWGSLFRASRWRSSARSSTSSAHLVHSCTPSVRASATSVGEISADASVGSRCFGRGSVATVHENV